MKKTKILDIAERTGVSCSTVSRVFNHKGSVKLETYKKVMTAAKEMGYSASPTKKNVAQEYKKIFVGIPTLGDTFFSEIIEGIHSSAVRHNYYVVLSCEICRFTKAEQVLDMCKSMNADGIILLRSSLPENEIIKLNKAINLVQCCDYYENTQICKVSIDDRMAAYEMTSYLISSGRKKIAFLACPYDTGGKVLHVKKREEGFCAAMRDNGVEINPDWIINVSLSSYDQAFAATRQMLGCHNKPDAIFAASDFFAAAAVNATKQCDLRVPEDIIISGFDNTIISRIIEPQLTTLNQPCHQIGYIACERLIDKMSNIDVGQEQITLNTELVIRRSTILALDKN